MNITVERTVLLIFDSPADTMLEPYKEYFRRIYGKLNPLHQLNMSTSWSYACSPKALKSDISKRRFQQSTKISLSAEFLPSALQTLSHRKWSVLLSLSPSHSWLPGRIPSEDGHKEWKAPEVKEAVFPRKQHTHQEKQLPAQLFALLPLIY